MSFVKLASAMLLSLASIVSFNASATVLTQTQSQTVAGQDFTFVFSGLNSQFTGGGTLTFVGRGDYSILAPFSEYLSASAEGINFGNLSYITSNWGPLHGFNDTQWSRTFNLSHAQLSGLLADEILTVRAFLSNGVNDMTANSFVSVRFAYTPDAMAADVPEPGTLILLGIALAGFAAARRRKPNAG